MESSAQKPKPKPVTILVNNVEVTLPDRDTTGEALKSAAGVPAEFTLYRKHGDQLDEVDNEAPIKVHEREEFIAVSGQDVS